MTLCRRPERHTPTILLDRCSLCGTASANGSDLPNFDLTSAANRVERQVAPAISFPCFDVVLSRLGVLVDQFQVLALQVKSAAQRSAVDDADPLFWVCDVETTRSALVGADQAVEGYVLCLLRCP